MIEMSQSYENKNAYNLLTVFAQLINLLNFVDPVKIEAQFEISKLVN